MQLYISEPHTGKSFRASSSIFLDKETLHPNRWSLRCQLKSVKLQPGLDTCEALSCALYGLRSHSICAPGKLCTAQRSHKTSQVSEGKCKAIWERPQARRYRSCRRRTRVILFITIPGFHLSFVTSATISKHKVCAHGCQSHGCACRWDQRGRGGREPGTRHPASGEQRPH